MIICFMHVPTKEHNTLSISTYIVIASSLVLTVYFTLSQEGCLVPLPVYIGW